MRQLLFISTLAFLMPLSGIAAEAPGAAEFQRDIRPILQEFCYDCHGDGAKKGGVAFDEVEPGRDLTASRELWWKALKNLRAGLMPPQKKPQPTAAQKERITKWIKQSVFELDPRNPDPGRVTIRRLNRAEYRNTIHDLVGVDFDTRTEFPADDTGYGFDNIGDVLTLPTMLLEKYLSAAKTIIAKAVPTNSVTMRANNYERFFPKAVPDSAAGRRAYAHELLGDFSRKAFRRPVDEKTVKRLAALAESIYAKPGKTFEEGVAQGMVAVLASPRFLFREEEADPVRDGRAYPFVDEYALASRLSYFLWCSMPDEELFRLAREGRLRTNLQAQVARMLDDKRSEALVKNFTGQWLQARDIEGVPIEARFVLAREEKFDPEVNAMRKRFRELNDKPEAELTPEQKEELTKLRSALSGRFHRTQRADLNPDLRRAMRQETERVFDYILREDRSVLELIDSDYTFLNERLAKHYGLTNVVGEEMRRVTLPSDSPRGGILTQGTVLAVTSNPTRTSPVKRGLFILDNVLGTPPPPPPPNIPPLEDAAKGITNRAPSLRETLAAHRQNALCSSCHNRMDPLGLAMENFNALGMWRDSEFGEPIDAAGKLITGEEFKNVKELKRIVVKSHYVDFYRTLTQKLLTYALGRGLDCSDVETVDQIVARLEQANGRPSALLMGVVESAPFQKTRGPIGSDGRKPSKIVQQRAEVRTEP